MTTAFFNNCGCPEEVSFVKRSSSDKNYLSLHVAPIMLTDVSDKNKGTKAKLQRGLLHQLNELMPLAVLPLLLLQSKQ